MLARDGRDLEDDRDDRAAPTPTPREIAAEFVRPATRAGSPAMGMVMTLIIVVDEDDADERHGGRPRGLARAPRAGARRDPRRRPRRRRGQRPGRHRRRLERRDRADPAHAARSSSTPSPSCSRCCCPTPRSSSGGRPTRRTTRPPTRSARSPSAGSPTRPASRAARRTALLQPVRGATPPGNTDLAWTRLTPWRALLAAALDQHPLKVTGASVTAERISPSADLLAAWLRRPAQGRRSTRKNSERPGHHRGRAGDQARARSGSRRPDGKLATFSSPGPARPPGRAASAGRCPSCSPRSCAASTRTTSTPRPRASWSTMEGRSSDADAPRRGPRGRRRARRPPSPASCSTRLGRRPGRRPGARRSR